MIRVLIVARIPLVREGLRALLASEQDLRVEILPGVEAGLRIEAILARRPDVLLVDVEVLEREGWVLLRDLRDMAPDVVALVIGEVAADRRSANALSLGARGYLVRDSSAEELAAGIRAARQGLYVLHGDAADGLLSRLRTGAGPDGTSGDDEDDPASAADLIEPLSPRELDVLRLMARGLPNKQIGGELYITEHTVKFHIRAILGKLGASNRTEAVTLALQKGLVSL